MVNQAHLIYLWCEDQNQREDATDPPSTAATTNDDNSSEINDNDN